MLKYAVAIFSSLVLFTSALQAQSIAIPANALKQAAEREVTSNSTSEESRQRLERELITRVVADRRSALKQDTEKLLSLAAELKQHVDKTNSNVLSVDVIKKAEEIQKLARSVQDKMRRAY